MSRLDPKNREQAFAYQFEDDVRVLHNISLAEPDKFEKGLSTLEAHIAAYRNKRLAATHGSRAREKNQQPR